MVVWLRVAVAGMGIAIAGHASAQVPASLIGKWKVQRIIPTERVGCWDADRSKTLVGSTLSYQPHAMAWQGGQVPLIGIRAVVRTLTRKYFATEYGVGLEALGVKTATVEEVDLQHEDADVTGATTEVPGDTVLLATPARIVVSACGIFYEALRVKQ
jgi:hypothetical protein